MGYHSPRKCFSGILEYQVNSAGGFLVFVVQSNLLMWSPLLRDHLS